MKNESRTLPSALPGSSPTTIIAGLLSIILWCLALQSSYAGSATWNLSPTSGDWNTAANWTPATIPNSSTDVASFGPSSITSVSNGTAMSLGGITFAANAPAYTITAQAAILSFYGAGVVNNSAAIQNLSAINDLQSGLPAFVFYNSATSGGSTTYTLTSGTAYFVQTSRANSSAFSIVGGLAYFSDSASADHGDFAISGSFFGGAGLEGAAWFYGASTAGDATFNLYGPGSVSSGRGELRFFDSALAGNSSITLNGGTASNVWGSFVTFANTSSAATATVVANGGTNGGLGGTIIFSDDSLGGTSRIEVFGNGSLDISGHSASGLSVGSIEGNGSIILGALSLTAGANDLTTTYSGIMSGTGGSLVKTGRGRLTLSNANTYTGGTTVNRGSLLIRNSQGSATGTGPVQVTAGILGGSGIIAGNVVVGDAAGSRAYLSPGGHAKLGTLTIQGTLGFGADATYDFAFNSSRAASDQAVANGLTIDSSAVLAIVDNGNTALPSGTIFTVINNTAATPISGTFSNLADGSTLVVGSNTYQVSYEGGDGNDLTLTVVP